MIKPIKTSRPCWSCIVVWLVAAPIGAVFVVWVAASIWGAMP